MADRANLRTALASAAPVRWDVAKGLVAYPDAIARMEAEVAAIADGKADELIWLLEHPPLYTGGTSADAKDLLTTDRFPVFQTGRGGQYTYHGPGQRVAYVMLDLRKRGNDVRAFVAGLERWISATLAAFNIQGETREDRVGVWVRHGDREDKIAALGIRVRRGITFHGISINLDPDLSHFDGIVPCGITKHGVTSLAALGKATTMAELDRALHRNFHTIFAAEQKYVT